MKSQLYLCLLLAGVLIIAPGCYHATVVTDRAPSNQVVESRWAHSFINGLVPPSTVDVAQECANGVATVETQLSFLNLVASVVTFGLYSPMTITVACAAGTSAGLLPQPDMEIEEVTIPRGATQRQIDRAFHIATTKALRTDAPVAVRLMK